MNLYQLMKSGLFEADDMTKAEESEYDEEEIIEAIKSDKPEVHLKTIFGNTIWPKVKRWLDVELKDTEIDKEGENVIGGLLGAKLNAYLEKDKSETEYDENVKSLVRGLMNAFKKWNDEQVKPLDLPHDGIEEG